MESIEEQWNPPSSPDIMSDLWMNISDAKKAIKIWILDRGESWGTPTQNNKTRLQLHCILATCSFYIRIAQRGTYMESLHILHTIALLRLIHSLNHGTQHGILQALLNAMSISIDISSQRRLESELGYIINCRTCHICQHGELGRASEIQLMGVRGQ